MLSNWQHTLKRGSAEMEMMVWNIVLTTLVAILGFLMKGKMDDLDRLNVLLNKTREEIAREHIKIGRASCRERV